MKCFPPLRPEAAQGRGQPHARAVNDHDRNSARESRGHGMVAVTICKGVDKKHMYRHEASSMPRHEQSTLQSTAVQQSANKPDSMAYKTTQPLHCHHCTIHRQISHFRPLLFRTPQTMCGGGVVQLEHQRGRAVYATYIELLQHSSRPE